MRELARHAGVGPLFGTELSLTLVRAESGVGRVGMDTLITWRWDALKAAPTWFVACSFDRDQVEFFR